VGCDSVRVCNNDIGTLAQRGGPPVGGSGVVVTQGLLAPPERVQILANRITRMGGNGIQLVSPVGSAIIKDNIIDDVEDAVREHPLMTIAVAVGVGFIISSMRR